MRKLHLIRHARTEANDKHLYCGWTDLPLSERGKEELAVLKAKGGYPPVANKIYTSGLKRTEETLNLIYGEVDHEVDMDFCEMNFGAFEMHSYEELLSDSRYIDWISGDNEANVCPDGESGKQMAQRAIDAFHRVFDWSDGDVTVFTHGGVIAAIMDYLFPEEKNRYEWQPKNGEGYTVIFAKGITYEQIP